MKTSKHLLNSLWSYKRSYALFERGSWGIDLLNSIGLEFIDEATKLIIARSNFQICQTYRHNAVPSFKKANKEVSVGMDSPRVVASHALTTKNETNIRFPKRNCNKAIPNLCLLRCIFGMFLSFVLLNLEIFGQSKTHKTKRWNKTVPFVVDFQLQTTRAQPFLGRKLAPDYSRSFRSSSVAT